jgi:hypothetical protein
MATRDRDCLLVLAGLGNTGVENREFTFTKSQSVHTSSTLAPTVNNENALCSTLFIGIMWHRPIFSRSWH